MILGLLYSPLTILSNNSLIEQVKFKLEYNGLLTLTISRENIHNTLGYINISDYCEDSFSQASIYVEYTVNTTLRYYLLKNSIILDDLNITVNSHTTPGCLSSLLVEILDPGKIEIRKDTSGIIPILLSIRNGSAFLEPPRLKGIIQGISRLGVDTIYYHYKDEDMLLTSYLREDLYIEPFTKVIIQYSQIIYKKSFEETCMALYSVALSLNSFMEYVDQLNSIISRKIYNIKVTTSDRSNHTITLILLYVNPGDIEHNLIIIDNNIVSISFNKPSWCFIELWYERVLEESLNGEVNSSIPLNYYISADEKIVSYTARVSYCYKANMTFPSSQLEIDAEEEYPEIAPPPHMPPETLEDFLVAVIATSPIFIVTYWASSKIASIVTGIKRKSNEK